ncbi:MAG: SRPBCC family protein [Bacteroidota bacterium]
MKTFKKIFVILLALIVVLVIISFFLPKNYQVKRSVAIKSDKSLVFGLVSHFNQWGLWTPWTKAIDSTAVFTLEGEDGKVGTKRLWTGKVLGEGFMLCNALTPDQLFGYDLDFSHGKYLSKGRFEFESKGDSVMVSWIDEGDLGYNPMARYMGLFMDKMMGPDFEKGLAKLKKIAEERNSWPKIEETTIP